MDTPKKATSSALALDAPDHTYGSRTLGEDTDVWQHNAWYAVAYRDHVTPPPEHQAMVDDLLAQQAAHPVDDAEAQRYHCLLYTSDAADE